jgi:hypothetical protein
MAFLADLLHAFTFSQRAALWTTLILVSGWIVWKAVKNFRFHRRYKFPNLVPGLPLVGNALQIPSKDAYIYFQDLAVRF